ncbi:MAG TPA: ABC transporter permease [Thermodesulfobacteriaceae bacterium]|nr:ABC transporter permease [Thermodesulfobacteriaceae bacterium]
MKKCLPFASFLFTIIVWETAVRAFGISVHSMPAPSQVALGLWEMIRSGVIFHHITASLFRVTWGYFLAVCTAVPIGLVLGIWRQAGQLAEPLIQFLRPISPLAWIPFALLWLGIGDKPAVFLIFLSVFFPMLVFSMSGVSGIKKTYIRIAANFGLKGRDYYVKVILPAALPEIVTGLRISLGTAWVVIVAAEMIAVKSGLGYLIIDARNSLRMDHVIGAMIIIGATGLVLDRCIRKLEDLPAVKWSRVLK